MPLKSALKNILPKKLRNLRHLFYAWYGAMKYHHPSEEMLVIGVTGTSGKSSVIHFLRQMLESAGYKVGSLSTVDFYIAGEQKLNDKKMTMLGKMEIQRYLRLMADAGCQVAIVETTSEGYLQYRNRFINYDMMILTNLYPEHIEAHGGFENYKKAKLGIFEYVGSQKSIKSLKSIKSGHKTYEKINKVGIVNGNSQYVEEFLKLNFDEFIVFGRSDAKSYVISHKSSITAENIIVSKDGLTFKVGERAFIPHLFGEHNVMNIMAAISVLRALDVSWSVIEKAVNDLQAPPGRIEFIHPSTPSGRSGRASSEDFKVIVDYAFEPVALAALYQVADLLKPIRHAHGKPARVIHVCGSTGGGRDKARRMPIGRLVGEKADIFIVTDEDPYDEDPMEIIKTVSAGAQEVGKKLGKDLFEVLNRREAIKKAIEMAKARDLVLITGKGSEQAMCVGGGRMIPWDDRQIVREFL
ncbi:MAG: UDP-N-acetylmuramyl-tripeptide synthetase [Candidatus Magasanikbacteria bacterium]|nr:UDP-N-acetylmuramyl-tripeptide synthetase [Candidatus Magasanikbacteria bacterium]